MEIVPQPLTPEAFAPFGDVIAVPEVAGRTYYEDALGNLRPNARASLSVSLKTTTAAQRVARVVRQRVAR